MLAGVRTEIFALPRDRAIALLAGLDALHLAGTGGDGAPSIAQVHATVAGGFVTLHGVPPGLDGAVALHGTRVLATLPDDGATTPGSSLRESVSLHGRLERLGDGSGNARLPLDRIAGEARLGQELAPDSRRALLEALWRRGLPGDPAAIERVREANPDTPAPDFLAGPSGATLSCALDPRDLDAAVELLKDEYWNTGLAREVVSGAQLASGAWIGARDPNGRLIGNARATGDRTKYAWIYDVIVDPAWRGRGLGQALMRLLLDHPLVRGARTVLLNTRDAQGLYARFGFVDRATVKSPFATTAMVLRRF